MNKFLLGFVLIISSMVATAQDFRLEINKDNYIIHNDSDWTTAAQSNIYQLSVNNNSVGKNQRTVELYSLVEFHNPNGQKYDIINTPIYRIYTYGILECKNAIFNILNHWFVDSSNKIVYTETKDIDLYLVDMSTENTPRNDLYRLVCNK